MQTFKTALGTTTFERTYYGKGRDGAQLHIGLMAGGGWAVAPEGLPIADRQYILDVVTLPADREAALAWFDGRREAKSAQDYGRKVYFDFDTGDWCYVDSNSPVEKMEDLIRALRGGALDDATQWFQQRQAQYQAGEGERPASPQKLVDQRIIELLESTGGMDGNDLATSLEITPSVLMPILRTMREEGRVTVIKRMYYPAGTVADAMTLQEP
jgi:hypothetical protein